MINLEKLFKEETGLDTTYSKKSYMYPGRYNTYYEDYYVEWLEEKLEKYMGNKNEMDIG